MVTIFIVTQGDYSDYRIRAVFSSRELAETYVSGMGKKYDTPEIEEWALDAGEEFICQGYKVYDVCMDRDGNSKFDVELSSEVRSDQLAIDDDYYGKPFYQKFIIWAKSEKHAVKIANERRVQMIANGEWR